jgi:hypothetical protein
MEKDCDTSTAKIDTECNLWLMDLDPLLGCADPDANAVQGKGCLLVNKMVFEAIDGVSPNTQEIEGVGAWEEQIKYDHKIVRLNAVPDNTWLENNGQRVASCTMTILTENWILTGCVTKARNDACLDSADNDGDSYINDGCWAIGAAEDALTQCADSLDSDGDFWVNDGCPKVGATSEAEIGPAIHGYGPTNGSGLIEKITVNPMTDDLIYRQGFRPGKDNGVVTDLVDENCELANTLGEKLPGELPGGLTQVCGDVHITVRMLEGDLNLDCAVTVLDDQEIAFRYGTFFGLTLYDEWYDLAPECVNGVCYGVPDFDIDIKDLQFVFGRNYSTCQVPIPADQVPVAPPQP